MIRRPPIPLPRWLLTVKYGLFIAIGAAVYSTAAPSFDKAFEEWYTPIWAVGVMAAGAASLLGSFLPGALEKWGASALFALMLIYAFAPVALVLAGDTDRLAYSIIALTLSLLPYARAVQLWNRKSDGPARVDQ